MKVGIEWFGDEQGNGTEHHVDWTEMEETPLPGDMLHFKSEDRVPRRVIRKSYVETDDGWHVELYVR